MVTRPDGVFGRISTAEGERLAELAAQVPQDRVIVEVGADRGLSTCWLAYGAAQGNGARILTFDPWEWDSEARAAFDANLLLTGAHEFVEAFPYLAHEYPKTEHVGMLFHDAGHREAEILADWNFWLPMFADVAIFACHDFIGYVWDSKIEDWVETVPRVTHERFFERKLMPGATWSDVGLVDRLWHGTRAA